MMRKNIPIDYDHFKIVEELQISIAAARGSTLTKRDVVEEAIRLLDQSRRGL